MKILVWGLNYSPEGAGIGPFNTALCEFLAGRGHAVTMLASFPYYPGWKKRPEDSSKIWSTETINGVKVARVWHYVPKRPRTLTRIAHEASFLILSFCRTLLLERFDVAVVVSPPLGLGLFAWLFSRIKGTPFVFHVQDLQPDAALSLGMLKTSRFSQLLYKLEALAYEKAARVSSISVGMIRAFEGKGVPPEKIILFPNGVAVPGPEYFPSRGAFRKKYQIPPEISIATYSGNLGAKQGLSILFDVAEKLAGQPIKIVICGDGVRRTEMEQQAAERKLTNLLLVPFQDELGYREMQVDTSISLIIQQKGTGQFFFPSKLLSAMLFSKPVLAVADSESELAHAVKNSRCGYVVEPSKVDALVDALMEMCSPEKQRVMGENGKNWVAQYAFNVAHRDFEDELLKLIHSSQRQPGIPYPAHEK